MSGSSKAEREAMYTEFLRVEGYRPDLDQDGSVSFTRDLNDFFVSVTDDAEYFCVQQLVLLIRSQQLARARRVALQVNDAVSVAKVYLNGEWVVCSAQMYCSPPESFKPVFQPVMRAMERASRLFEETFLESGTPA